MPSFDQPARKKILKRRRLLSRVRGMMRDDVRRREIDRRPEADRPDLRPESSAADTTAQAPTSLPVPDLHQLEAEARYYADRLALYRARVLSAKPTSASRFRELQRASAAAAARLRYARGR